MKSFDFEQLQDRRVMAINVAFKEVPWSSCAVIGDTRLLDDLADDEDWMAFKGARYSRDTQLARLSKTQPAPIENLETQQEWSTNQGCVVSLGNTGLCGLNLAELLGWDPIFLLGFDADGDRGDGRMANYHDHYPKDWAKPEAFSRQKFVRVFESVRRSITTKVYNCNPKSSLDCFEKITMAEAIALCRLS